MTVQKIYSRTNTMQASENPNGKTVAQVDDALRDFVLQDTAHLRREAETASQGALRREPESATEVVIGGQFAGSAGRRCLAGRIG